MQPDVDERRQRALRGRIRRLVSSDEAGPAIAPADVVVSHVEVCGRHGTGVMTKLVFGGTPGLVSVRCHDQYGGEQEFGDRALRLHYAAATIAAARAAVLRAFGEVDVRRIVCIPYFAEDVVTAIALKEIFGAPLCTFVMDDNNVEADGIPDPLLRDLLRLSDLRLAISAELREAYEEKFGLRFGFVPPLVPPALVLREVALPGREVLEERRGVVIGNLWGREWLARLRETVRGSGIALDWYCAGGIDSLGATPAELAADGIRAHGAVPEQVLVPALRRAPYVVVPSGTLDATDSRRAIARFSLPSRVTYVLATSHAPLLVVGHPATAAARFVTSRGVGISIPYDRRSFAEAVKQLVAPATQAGMRARAASLAPAFSAEGVREWIWRSLEIGRPADDRWECIATIEGSHPC